MKIATAKAPSNIAFIKYWGVYDPNLRIPSNSSISMNLDKLHTVTTVEFRKNLRADEITIDGVIDKKNSARVSEHLDRLRNIAGVKTKAIVVSKNNFPRSTGLSSSASGFAALTLAGASSLGLELCQKDLSIIARLGSGSSCRSIPDGFVEWHKGKSHSTSYSESIYPKDYWGIVDIVVIFEEKEKDFPTTESLRNAGTSIFFDKRIRMLGKKTADLKEAIRTKNFRKFGSIVEDEALEMHAVILTQKPSRIYLKPSTISVMNKVRLLRCKGLDVYFTINTGHNIHLICEENKAESVYNIFKNCENVKGIILNRPSVGARLIQNHLF